MTNDARRFACNLQNGNAGLKVGSVPAASHINGQGYKVAQLEPGPKSQIILSTGGGIYYFDIPPHPEEGNWPRTLVTEEATDEGFAVGDIDGDGLPDIAAAHGKEGNLVAWWKNPGPGKSNWQEFPVGSTVHWKDRTGLADINGDGRLDIIITEESYWKDDSVYVFEQPPDPKSPNWPRHSIVTQFTTNSLDVADMNNDGRPDIITAEHRGTKKLSIWENVGDGFNLIEHIISTGRENHLGAQVADMDGDGDLDIVGIAWDDYAYVHLWRNDAKYKLGGASVVATPSIDPAGGKSSGPFTVTIATRTPGATIRCTLDGSDPSSSSALYVEPLEVAGSGILKARAFKTGVSDSAVATASFSTSHQH